MTKTLENNRTLLLQPKNFTIKKYKTHIYKGQKNTVTNNSIIYCFNIKILKKNKSDIYISHINSLH